MMINPQVFDRAETFNATVPIFRVSKEPAAMHRFFDTSPISPSGRFVAYTEFSDDTRSPKEGDLAHVVVRDLLTAELVFRQPTAAWDTQLGAQVQWGASDKSLFFNRLVGDENHVRGVVCDIKDGTERKLTGSIYMVSPNGRLCATPAMEKLQNVQVGYGVRVPQSELKINIGAPANDGVFVTDLETGEQRLILSFRSIYEQLKPHFIDIDLKKGGFYGFHVKWSPDSMYLMFILRWKPLRSNKTRNYLITLDADGTNPRMIVSAKAWANGHHPNWHPNSNSIIMNVPQKGAGGAFDKIDRIAFKTLRKLGFSRSRGSGLVFGQYERSGEGLTILADHIPGSGHPSVHASGRYILTDAYPWEEVSAGDGTVPLRLIDLHEQQDRLVARVPATPRFYGDQKEWRVDPHPTWHRDGRHISFNAAPGGARAVYIADLSSLL